MSINLPWNVNIFEKQTCTKARPNYPAPITENLRATPLWFGVRLAFRSSTWDAKNPNVLWFYAKGKVIPGRVISTWDLSKFRKIMNPNKEKITKWNWSTSSGGYFSHLIGKSFIPVPNEIVYERHLAQNRSSVNKSILLHPHCFHFTQWVNAPAQSWHPKLREKREGALYLLVESPPLQSIIVQTK